MPTVRKSDSEKKRTKDARRKRYESSHKIVYLKLECFEKLQHIAQKERLTIGKAAAVVINAYCKKDLDTGRASTYCAFDGTKMSVERRDTEVLDIPNDDDHDMEDDEDDDEILSMTCHGEDEELQADVNRSPEKPSNERGGNPSLEITHQVPGLLHVHERDTQHQIDTGTEGCKKKLIFVASGETNVQKNLGRYNECNAKSVTLNDSTSKACRINMNYSCIICSKMFGQGDALKRHMLLHTVARPFHCPICNKAFARKELLALHMETSTHSTSPPTCAACSICNKTFSMDALARHMRSHTTEEPHHCASCGKSFIRKEHLSLHMQTHAKEKSFQCSICDKAFPVQINLDMHHYLAHTLEESASKTQHSSVDEVTS